MGIWAKAALAACALMAPGIVQAQSNEREVGDWLLAVGDKSCVASVGEGDQVFSLFTVGESSGFYMMSPEADGQPLGEDQSYAMQLGSLSVTFGGWVEKVGDYRGFKVPISIVSMTGFKADGYMVTASLKGQRIFALDLQRPGTTEVFREMTDCETRLRGRRG